jgi:hypothetical protein
LIDFPKKNRFDASMGTSKILGTSKIKRKGEEDYVNIEFIIINEFILISNSKFSSIRSKGTHINSKFSSKTT